MPEHRFRVANKECHRNYVSIDFKRATLEISTKELEEEETTRLQGWQEKPRKTPGYGKSILISQVKG